MKMSYSVIVRLFAQKRKKKNLKTDMDNGKK